MMKRGNAKKIALVGSVLGGVCALANYLKKRKDGDRKTIDKFDIKASEVGFEDYGCYKHFSIDKNRNVRVLIAGANSYIGESFKNYCAENYPNIGCSAIDTVDERWRDSSFDGFDTVFHVAGIAHADVGKASEDKKKKYYVVNTDLAIEMAEKAKNDRVPQFIFMSSMIVYGGVEYIDEHTIPAPTNFYGDSKWRADKGVRELADENFHVAVVRSPMVYGKGCKGNYPTLAKIAKKTPIFPKYKNKRSMLYIENLCEFVALLILSGEGGIYFPQNNSFSNTGKIVRLIGEMEESPVYLTKLLSPAVGVALRIRGKVSSLARKAFGSCYYDQDLSRYDGLDYQLFDLRTSIMKTES